MLQTAFPMCTSEDLNRGKFPWSNLIHDDDGELCAGKFFRNKCTSPLFHVKLLHALKFLFADVIFSLQVSHFSIFAVLYSVGMPWE